MEGIVLATIRYGLILLKNLNLVIGTTRVCEAFELTLLRPAINSANKLNSSLFDLPELLLLHPIYSIELTFLWRVSPDGQYILILDSIEP